MVKRIASTLILWSLIATLVHFFRREGAMWLCAVIAFGSQYELYTMMIKAGREPFRGLGVSFGLLMFIIPYYVHHFGGIEAMEGMQGAIIAIAIVACCLRVMRERRGIARIETLIFTAFGILYLPFMIFFLVRIMWLGTTEVGGVMLTIWLLFAAKFCDVGGLLVGMVLGRHKIAPTMSPGKTWEGAIGGVMVAAGMCAGLVAVFPQHYPAGFTPLVAALAAIPASIVSIPSDLIESVCKRMADVKDSGATIPGIGGAFDLVDSIILAAPVGYLTLRMLI